MDDFSSWLLEIVKPAYQQPIDRNTFNAVIEILENNLKVLHPFMPFLTEEIWQHITERSPEEALIIAKYPKIKDFNQQIISDFDFATAVVSGLRTVRKEKNISFKDTIELFVIDAEENAKEFDTVIQKLTNTSTINYVAEKVDGASFRVKSNEYFVPISATVPGDSEVVVEVKFPDDGVTIAAIGTNLSGTGTSWVNGCGIAGPVDLADFLDNDWELSATGDSVLSVGDNIADVVNVFPNPATDVLNVRVPSNVTIQSASLFDILGKNTGAVLSNGTIDMSNLARGVYILNVETDRGTLTDKIVKQ